jgi:hypothetical protein
MGSAMNTHFTRMFPLVIFLYSLGQFIFLDRLSDGKNFMSQIVMWVCLAYLLSPFKTVENYVVENIKRSDEVTYESCSKNFLFDYEKSNPVQFHKDEFPKDNEENLDNGRQIMRKITFNFTSLRRYGKNQSLRNRIQDSMDFNQLFERVRFSNNKNFKSLAHFGLIMNKSSFAQ